MLAKNTMHTLYVYLMCVCVFHFSENLRSNTCVYIVMFDVRQHLYGDFVFEETFIPSSLMVQLEMNGASYSFLQLALIHLTLAFIV